MAPATPAHSQRLSAALPAALMPCLVLVLVQCALAHNLVGNDTLFCATMSTCTPSTSEMSKLCM
jgi:hypothetical protein